MRSRRTRWRADRSIAACRAGCVMEDDAGRAAATARDAADAVFQAHAMPAARAACGTVMRRDDRGVALRERDDTRGRLRARPLLDEHELAAVEVAPGFAEQDHGL